MALVSSPGGVIRLVLMRVAALVAIGVVVAAVVFTAIGAVAGWLPAYRASRIDPADVLRDS